MAYGRYGRELGNDADARHSLCRRMWHHYGSGCEDQQQQGFQAGRNAGVAGRPVMNRLSRFHRRVAPGPLRTSWMRSTFPHGPLFPCISAEMANSSSTRTEHLYMRAAGEVFWIKVQRRLMRAPQRSGDVFPAPRRSDSADTTCGGPTWVNFARTGRGPRNVETIRSSRLGDEDCRSIVLTPLARTVIGCLSAGEGSVSPQLR